MMGKNKLTPMEEAILVMMLERQALGEHLTPARLRWRKTGFFMRNLKRIDYRTLGDDRRVRLLVSPLTFLFQVFTASTFNQSYDHYRTEHLKALVVSELDKVSPPKQDKLLKKLDIKKQVSQTENKEELNFKEGTVLRIQLPEEGINLETFKIKQPEEAMTIFKLDFTLQVCQFGKPARTVFRRIFTGHQLLSKDAIL